MPRIEEPTPPGDPIAATARVAAIFTAPSAGAPVERRATVEVVPGIGIVGDRYAVGLGHWSDPRWPDQELTLVEAEVAEALGVEPGRLRRNIVTRDVRLSGLVGVRFRIGEVLLAGVRPCDPCGYLEAFTRPGFAHELGGRGGLRARILTAGRIREGETIRLALDGQPAQGPVSERHSH